MRPTYYINTFGGNMIIQGLNLPPKKEKKKDIFDLPEFKRPSVHWEIEEVKNAKEVLKNKDKLEKDIDVMKKQVLILLERIVKSENDVVYVENAEIFHGEMIWVEKTSKDQYTITSRTSK